jgi:hypothetical protein
MGTIIATVYSPTTCKKTLTELKSNYSTDSVNHSHSIILFALTLINLKVEKLPTKAGLPGMSEL